MKQQTTVISVDFHCPAENKKTTSGREPDRQVIVNQSLLNYIHIIFDCTRSYIVLTKRSYIPASTK